MTQDDLKSAIMEAVRRAGKPVTQFNLAKECGQVLSMESRTVNESFARAINSLIGTGELREVGTPWGHPDKVALGDKAAKTIAQLGPPMTVTVDPSLIDPAFANPVPKTQPRGTTAVSKATKSKAKAKAIAQPVATVRVNEAPPTSMKGLWAELDALRAENEQLRSSAQQASPVEVLAANVQTIEAELNELNNQAMAIGQQIQQKEDLRTVYLKALRELKECVHE